MTQIFLTILVCLFVLIVIVYIGYILIAYSNHDTPSEILCILFLCAIGIFAELLLSRINVTDVVLEHPVKEYTTKCKIDTIDNNADTTYFFERNVKTN